MSSDGNGQQLVNYKPSLGMFLMCQNCRNSFNRCEALPRNPRYGIAS